MQFFKATVNGNSQMTEEESNEHMGFQQEMSQIVARATLIQSARNLLIKSDIIIIRFFERGFSVPKSWVDYRASLRSIITNGDGEIPEIPDYTEPPAQEGE